MQYGRLEEADALIEQLQRDKDPILRRSAMYTVAMAYCGTGNNTAVRKLLHVAVSVENLDSFHQNQNTTNESYRLVMSTMMFAVQLLNHLVFLCFGKSSFLFLHSYFFGA